MKFYNEKNNWTRVIDSDYHSETKVVYLQFLRDLELVEIDDKGNIFELLDIFDNTYCKWISQNVIFAPSEDGLKVIEKYNNKATPFILTTNNMNIFVEFDIDERIMK